MSVWTWWYQKSVWFWRWSSAVVILRHDSLIKVSDILKWEKNEIFERPIIFQAFCQVYFQSCLRSWSLVTITQKYFQTIGWGAWALTSAAQWASPTRGVWPALGVWPGEGQCSLMTTWPGQPRWCRASSGPRASTGDTYYWLLFPVIVVSRNCN